MRRFVGSYFLKILGWHITSLIPGERKFVLIAAPHTSNWDFFIGLATSWVLGLRISWLAKHTLFFGPVGWVLRNWGGIPVNRTNPHKLVKQMKRLFVENSEMIIGITPEGTRKYTRYWKSGFYHIATQANTSVALAYFDYEKKECGIGKLVKLSGNVDQDMKTIAGFYKNKAAKFPEKFGPIILRRQLKSFRG